MEKHYFTIRTLLLLYLSAMFAAASAQQVSQDEAARIASQFLSAQNQGSRAKKAAPDALKLVYTEPSAKDKTPNLYVFNMEGGGFAIVSADERTGSQILGYSFDNNFSTKGMPDNVKYWLGEYSRQIDFIKAHQPEVSESKRRGGMKMEEGGYVAPVAPENVTEIVEPLLSTTWGQSAPYYGMTPTLKNSQQENQHTVTGCVATAMAQIMNYHKCPNSDTPGKGKHSYYWWDKDENDRQGAFDLLSADFSEKTYDWDNMTDSYNETQPYNSNNANMKAVAQLMSDCGIAVDMDYGLESSGASDDKVVTALTSYFGYSHNISLRRQSETEFQGVDGNTAWIKLLTDELDAERPVYYAAEDATPNDDDAHAFVLDGYGTYNNETYFHINWGWDGYDGYGTKTANGYFKMNKFNPRYREEEETDEYNLNSVAIVGIYPAEDDEITFDNLEEGWDDEGNWETEESYGKGEWADDVAYYNHPKSNMVITRQQNKTYNDIYRMSIKSWESTADGIEYTEPPVDNKYTKFYSQDENSNISLVFYWNTYTNDCYLPSQNTGLIKEHKQVQDTYFGNQIYNNSSELSHEILIGRFDPAIEVFNLPFYSEFLRLEYKCKGSNNSSKNNIPNVINPWKISDPKELFEKITSLGNNQYYTSDNDTTYKCSVSGLRYTLESSSYNGMSINAPIQKEKFDFVLEDRRTTATLTLTPAPTHKALYLGDFTENTDEDNKLTGTAKQVAGIIKRENGTYRIGLMPVNENTTRSEIYAFAQELSGDVINKSSTDATESRELTIPKEGAYYVVAANYENNDGTGFVSYEYMPVFYSSSDKWETLVYGKDELPKDEDDIDYEYNYIDDIIYAAYYTCHDNDYNVQELNVEVQQYIGGSLIKNADDKLFRIKNPYGEGYEPSYYVWNDELVDEDGKQGDYDWDNPVTPTTNINGENETHRKDVYLYLYVDANNNVSLFPDYFESQPLGLDWGSGEMMVKQNATGTYIETTPESYDANTIVYDKSVDKVFYDMEFAQYFIDGTIAANYDTHRFLLQLPSTLKNYLTLYDDEPYTLVSPPQEYYSGVYYSRELDENNNWGTLMLPFAFNPADIDADFTFYKLTGASSSQLTFTEIPRNEFSTDVAANTPIIFKRADGSTKSLDVSKVVESGFVDLASCNDAISPTYNDVNGWTFKGLYNSGVITKQNAPDELTKCYFFEGDKVRRVTNKITLKQYRGYFHDDQGVLAGAKQLAVIINNEEYTSLDALFNGEQPVKKYGKGRFNLQGQAVGKNYKGVVIEDGRKKLRF